MNKYKNNFGLVSLLILAGCNSGGGYTSGGQTNMSAEVKPEGSTIKNIMFSRMSTIPTNTGISTHQLKIDNNSNEDLKFDSTKISSTEQDGIFSRAYDSLSRMVGGTGYDSRFNLLGCTDGTLQHGSSCTISFTPNAKNGSTGISMVFQGVKSKKLYAAAQLISYSSNVTRHDGFIVDDSNINYVVSENNYSLSIPFIADDDYTQLHLDSRIKPINQSLSCNGSVTRGTHCTALLTMPVAVKGVDYSNMITLSGDSMTATRSTAVRSVAIASGARNATATASSLLVTGGPLVLNVDGASGIGGGKVVLVNNGSQQITGIRSEFNNWKSWNNSLIGAEEFIKFTSLNQCAAIDSGDVCTLEFETKQDHSNTSGYVDLNVKFGGGLVKSTKIYQIGLGDASGGRLYDFRFQNTIDFQNTQTNQTSQKTLTIVNTSAQNALYNPTITGLPRDFEYKPSSTCDKKTLNVNESCNFVIAYAPTADIVKTFAMITVSADTNPNGVGSISQKIAMPYSAVSSGGDAISFSPATSLSFKAGYNQTISQTINIQNLGSTNFIIDKINVIKGSWPTGDSSLDASVVKINNLNAVTESIALANGESAGSITIESGSTAQLRYTYQSKKVNVTATTFEHQFAGKFDRTGNVTGNSASTNNISVTHSVDETGGNGIVIVDPNTTDPSNQSCQNCVGLSVVDPNGNSTLYIKRLANINGIFILTRNSILEAHFKYKNGSADKKSFILDDGNLPFGFMVDSDRTTCPSAAKSDKAGIFSANSECSAYYLYLAPELHGEFFYQTAVNNNPTINLPGYSYVEGGNVYEIAANTSSQLSAQANAFANVTATSIPQGLNEYRVTFTNNTQLSSGEITVAIPKSGTSGTSVVEITPVMNGAAAGQCTLKDTVKSTCEIDFMIPANTTGNLQFNALYQWTKEPDFNRGYVTVTVTVAKP